MIFKSTAKLNPQSVFEIGSMLASHYNDVSNKPHYVPPIERVLCLPYHNSPIPPCPPIVN